MSPAPSSIPAGRPALSSDEGFELLARALRPIEGRARLEAVPDIVILAVSGGPDSLALLHLAAENADRLPVRFHVVTVDHGLRAASAAEAESVGAIARSLGLLHETRLWTRRAPTGNLQAQARRARYDLLTDTAFRLRALAVMTAHHRDDQIETHLLAAARGSGDRGLAGMRAARDLAPGLLILRPFLDIPGDRLKRTSAKAGLAVVDDPSNRDQRFARVRLRSRVASGEIDGDAVLSAIAAHAARRDAADARLSGAVAQLLAEGDLSFGADGAAALNREAFAALACAPAGDLLSRLLAAASGREHPPERAAIDRLATRIRTEAARGDVATLAGVRIEIGHAVVFEREYGRLGPPERPLAPGSCHAVFDGRFDIALDGLDPPADEAEPAVDAGTLAPFGRFGRGSRRERTLPVLLDAAGDVRGAHPLLLPKLADGTAGLVTCERVSWRCLADLGLSPVISPCDTRPSSLCRRTD